MYEFERVGTGFDYVFEKEITGTVIIKLPGTSSNKRSVSDIGWQGTGDFKIYGTVSENYEATSLWEELESGDAINKAVRALKIECGGADACLISIRVIYE